LSAPVRIALLGASGRMGQAVLEAAAAMEGVKITAALVGAASASLNKSSHGVTYGSDIAAALGSADVLLDFSLPASTGQALEACLKAGKPLVTGVTGMDESLKARLAEAAKRIPVLAAPNMSLGIALLSRMAEQAAKVLGPDFDIEISEAHHRHKKDAPSGTALRLAEVMSKARGSAPIDKSPQRQGPRQPGSIGFSVLRAGDIVGEHTVLFAGAGERLELSHRAQSRSTFAHGALSAAHWIAHRQPGLYNLADTFAA
jgi:4-hydroxy-tetrahydrodipicolinate reductase